jgi:hypothetical protein
MLYLANQMSRKLTGGIWLREYRLPPGQQTKIVQQKTYRKYMADMARRIQAATRTANVKLKSCKLTGGIWMIWLGESRLPPGQQR